jgi:hypothetical protein
MSHGARAAPNIEPVSVNPQTLSLPNSGSPQERAERIPQQTETKKSRESAAKSAGKVKALHNTG